jgi:hypothetical protein
VSGLFHPAGDEVIAAATALTQLVLAGPWPVLQPTLLRSHTSLVALRSLTLHWYTDAAEEAAAKAAFATLSSLPYLTALHLLHGGPWDPSSSADQYLRHTWFFLADSLQAFHQLVELSVFLICADIRYLSHMTSLRRLLLAVYMPRSWGEDITGRLEAQLVHLSGLRQLDTLHLAPIRPTWAGDKPGPISDRRTWGLLSLPCQLSTLTALRELGLHGSRTHVLPTIPCTVEELELSECSISLAPADLARRSQLRTLTVRGVTGIAGTAQDPHQQAQPRPAGQGKRRKGQPLQQQQPPPPPPPPPTSCLTVLRLAGSVDRVGAQGLLGPKGR